MTSPEKEGDAAMFNVKNTFINICEEDEDEAPFHRRIRTWPTEVKPGESADQEDESPGDTTARSQVVAPRFEDDLGPSLEVSTAPVVILSAARHERRQEADYTVGSQLSALAAGHGSDPATDSGSARRVPIRNTFADEPEDAKGHRRRRSSSDLEGVSPTASGEAHGSHSFIPSRRSSGNSGNSDLGTEYGCTTPLSNGTMARASRKVLEELLDHEQQQQQIHDNARASAAAHNARAARAAQVARAAHTAHEAHSAHAAQAAQAAQAANAAHAAHAAAAAAAVRRAFSDVGASHWHEMVGGWPPMLPDPYAEVAACAGMPLYAAMGSPPPHSYFGVPSVNHCGVPPSRGWMPPHGYEMQQSPLRHPSLSECINDAAASAQDSRTGRGRRGFGSAEVGEARGDHVDPKMASSSCFQGKAKGASRRRRGNDVALSSKSPKAPIVHGRPSGKRALRLWAHIHLQMQATGFDLVPMLIGHGGSNVRRIVDATGAKIRIRGRGSGHLEVDGKFEAPTPLMWAVTADYEDAEGFRNAVEMTLAELRTVEHRFLVFCQKKGHVQEGPCFSIGSLPEVAEEVLAQIIDGVPRNGAPQKRQK